ncbi:MAG: hypothetical protein Q8K82_12865 [Gemmatimonadaceae bacterium]|nr:hypothetical protein [Gemmatimonadaceae bacterium]
MDVDANRKTKDLWDKLAVVAQFLIPISVVLVGFIVNSALKQQEIRAEYVKLAVAALQSPDQTGPAREVKKWALSVLDRMSPVPMPPELEADALGIQIERGGYVSGGGFGVGSGWGFVEVRSIPSLELFVYADGRLRATTPTTLNLPIGPHTIELRTADGGSVGTSELQLKERSQMVIFCKQSNVLVAGEITGSRMPVRPRCPEEK